MFHDLHGFTLGAAIVGVIYALWFGGCLVACIVQDLRKKSE